MPDQSEVEQALAGVDRWMRFILMGLAAASRRSERFAGYIEDFRSCGALEADLIARASPM